MITDITKGIKVSVETEYQQDYSNPVQKHFVFTYQITIENLSDKTIQLISRHWDILDITFPRREVDGEGVVGKQPVLEPGQMHQYVSGCNFKIRNRKNVRLLPDGTVDRWQAIQGKYSRLRNGRALQTELGTLSDPLFHFTSCFSQWYRARNAHGLHSPFVFELYNQTIKDRNLELSEVLYTLRTSLRKNRTSVEIQDLKSGKVNQQTIGSIVKRSGSTIKFQTFLSQLTDYLGCKTILETGTSLGLTTVALALSDAERVVSIEASEPIHQEATQFVSKLPVSDKITLIKGTLEASFEIAVRQWKPDLIFLDADHRSQAVAYCMDTIMSHLPDVTCIVIHDIYWSKDMNNAWNRLVKDERFTITIDLFEAGILFPKYPSEKQHFLLRF